MEDFKRESNMPSESVLMSTPEKKPKKKRIAIMEPHERSGTHQSKFYRKSVFPRESMDPVLTPRRQSSAGDLLNSLMGPGFPSMPSRTWASRRSTMYMSPRFQNNYCMESKHPFNRERVQLLVDRYLDAFLDQYKHNPRRSKRLAENLSIDLCDLIKRCGFDRYRILAVVTVGDKACQDFKSVMRFVWDAEKDGYVNFAYESMTYFVIATVFAVYYE